VTSPPVQLENGHVPCGANHEERHDNSRDWQIDVLLDLAAESPCCGEIWRTFAHLCDVGRVLCEMPK
jgi:hypothetical protein